MLSIFDRCRFELGARADMVLLRGSFVNFVGPGAALLDAADEDWGWMKPRFRSWIMLRGMTSPSGRVQDVALVLVWK